MKTRRKIVAVLTAFAVAASAGALLVSRQVNAAETGVVESLDKTGRLFGIEIPAHSLTEGQKLDILGRVADLKKQGISLEEIRTEIQNILQKFEIGEEQNGDINEMVERINERFNWAKNHEFSSASHRSSIAEVKA